MSKKPALSLVKDPTIAMRSPGGIQKVERIIKDLGTTRMDGWKNLYTLLGTNADKRTHSHIKWEYRDPEFFEQLYAGGGIPARIVDLIPEEACRRWIDWLDLEDEEEKLIEDRFLQLDVRGGFMKSWKWGRSYGGGCLHIVTNTRDPASPLQEGEKVIGLRDLSRWDLRVLTTDIEYDFASPNFGHPRIYYLNLQMGSQYKGYPIHWTRMIRFDGQLVPRRTFIRNGYWHDSILNRLYDTIRDYQTSNDAAAACLQDFNVDVVGIKNLANLIATGKEKIVQRRLQTIQFSKSVLNSMLIDSDHETYENKGRSLEGVAELLKHQANRLVAETDIPHTKLLGESPDGSNATGNSTSQMWINFIQAEQDNYAKPKLARLVSVILADNTKKFHFRPMRVLDELEQADLHLKQAQADQVYLAESVVDPTEIAKSRFGGKEYSTETELDMDARDAGLIGQTAQEQLEESPQETDETGGIQAPEGKGKPGEPEPGKFREPEGEKGKDITGKPPAPKKKPAASKTDSDDSEQVEGRLQESLAYQPRHSETPMPKGKPVVPKDKTQVTQVMSEPMRDPNREPILPGPGIPKTPRTIMPTVGNGVTAPSGSVPGAPVEDIPLQTEGQELGEETPEGTESGRKDVGVAATMKEFAKGTLKSGSGHKVTDPKQAAAIGYSEERGDAEPKRAAQIIVRDGDTFLMGRRRDTKKWALPGGHVEEGESHHQGAIRELAEETGLEAKKLKFLGARMCEPEQGKTVHVNLYQHHLGEDADGEKLKPTHKNDPDKEFSKLQWVSAKEPLPKEIAEALAHPNDVGLQHLGLLK